MSDLPAKRDPAVVDSSVFLESSGVPSFWASMTEIYDYVEGKANEVGEEVRGNRGVPGAAAENMLSPEEKALVILGVALCVPMKDIEERINFLRVTNGSEPTDGTAHKFMAMNYPRRYRHVVSLIQEEVFAALEHISPLVLPRLRFQHRATIMEYYRRKMMEIIMNPHRLVTAGDVDNDGALISIEQHVAIMKLDRAMQPHMKFFDKIAAEPDFNEKLIGPSEQVRKAREASRAAEDAIQRDFDAGKITDEERINALRELRHGREAEDDDQ